MMNSKIRTIGTWILASLVSLIFIGSALLKLMGSDATVEMAKFLGGKDNLLMLAVLEFVIVVLFIFPRTGIVGALMMIAYFGGVMAVNFVNHQSIVAPTIVEALIWISAALRFPELTQRLFRSS